MLEQDVDDIPDLRLDTELLVTEPPFVASPLRFDCSPKHTFLGSHISGKRIALTENVFYTFRGEKIEALLPWKLGQRTENTAT